VLDSRGLLYLRLGQFDKAITDYDAALQRRPNSAASRFGRGIAKLRSGNNKGGDFDVDMAKRSDPAIALRFAAYGLAP
jgi:tetratricopeptide (TPR) repeat protein